MPSLAVALPCCLPSLLLPSLAVALSLIATLSGPLASLWALASLLSLVLSSPSPSPSLSLPPSLLPVHALSLWRLTAQCGRESCEHKEQGLMLDRQWETK